MDALLFALFVVSFAAPAIVAGVIALTTSTPRQGQLTLLIAEVVTIFAVISFHTWAYSAHPSWSGNGFVILPYVFVGLIANVSSIGWALDVVSKF